MIRRDRTHDDASTVTKENHTVIRLTCLVTIAALSSFASLLAAGPAAAAEEPHPPVGEFGHFTNPNGIAVDEATGDVYVADIAGTNEQQTVNLQGGPEGGSFALEFQGQRTSALYVNGTSAPAAGEVDAALQSLSTIGSANVVLTEEGALPETLTYTISFQGSLAARNVASLTCDGSALTGGTGPSCAVSTTSQGIANTVSKFDSDGNPVNFTAGSAFGTNELTGADTPAAAFEFPNVPDNPAAIAVDNSTDLSDPSVGDLYVMDAGHGVIDKFAPGGEYLGQIAGPVTGELIGLGVDAHGDLHVAVNTFTFDLYDSSPINQLLQAGSIKSELLSTEILGGELEHGFAVSGSGDSYALFNCGCFDNLGPNIENLGPVDAGSALAAAADPATAHLYVDDGSSVTEWDTGQMNGGSLAGANKGQLVATFGASRISASSGQGGIAISGTTGRVYVSNPADGKVYVFASTAPAPVAGSTNEVTQTEATLHATVNPRGTPLASCQFEYVTSAALDLTRTFTHFDEDVPCDRTPSQIGAGDQPVPVTAKISSLAPGSLYRFRLVVANATGSSASAGLFPTVSPGFGIKQFGVSFLNQDGTPDTQAGSHPYKLLTNIEFNTHVVRQAADNLRWVSLPQGNLKDLSLDLPPGFFGDPGAPAKDCTLAELDLSSAGLGSSCPAQAELGSISVLHSEYGGLTIESISQPLFSIVPPPGLPFQIAGHILKPNSFINVDLPAGRDSRLQATSIGVPATVPVYGITTTVFGTPPNGAVRPLLTMPTACNGPLTSRLSVDSYQEPGRVTTASSSTTNAAGNPAGMSGCAKLLFPPNSTSSPDVSNASSPTGLEVGLHVPQNAGQSLGGLAESNVRDITTTLPKGFTLNPSNADGLQGCTETQAGFTGFEEFNPTLEPGDRTATFTPGFTQPLEPGIDFCPNASKIATAEIRTPLLNQPLEGSLYLATPYQNPFGSLVALYLFAEDPVSGTIIKQVGQVHLDPQSGQIVTTFHNTPNVPFEDLTLHLYGGDRAPLVTPATCGTYKTDVEFTPWSGNGPINTISDFQIDHGQDGAPCPSEGAPPFHPHLNAGTRSNAAGSYSPLDIELSRGDSEQEFTHFSLKLPPGLAGNLSWHPRVLWRADRRRPSPHRPPRRSGRGRNALLFARLRNRPHPGRRRGGVGPRLGARQALPRRPLPRLPALGRLDHRRPGRRL